MRRFSIASLAALAALIAGNVSPAPATVATVVNGDFETGSLVGWQLDNAVGTGFSPNGSWFAYTGTTSPLNSTAVPPPPQGSWAAITDQFSPSRQILFQDVSLEPAATHQLSLIVYYHSDGPISARNDLDPNVATPYQENQQYRIDVMKPSAPISSVSPADILLTVFRTLNGDPQTLAPTQKGANLSSLAGQMVRLRFAEVGTQSNFYASADAISIKSATLATCRGKQATIVGTDGADKLSGTPAADVIAGLGANDKVSGLAGNDLICGGKGADLLRGGSGNDFLGGQKGNDRLYGQKGNDKLSGKSGNDTLKGGPGKDKLKGGPGKDKQVQ